MNLWELEGGTACAHSPWWVSFLRREWLVGGHRGNTLSDPIGSRVAPTRKHGRRPQPCVQAGLGGFSEHSTGNQPRTCQGAGCLAVTVWPVTLCYPDSSLGQKKG